MFFGLQAILNEKKNPSKMSSHFFLKVKNLMPPFLANLRECVSEARDECLNVV